VESSIIRSGELIKPGDRYRRPGEVDIRHLVSPIIRLKGISLSKPGYGVNGKTEVVENAH
jgi:hypothetical protein